MTRKKCGCYDGPFSEHMQKTLVSVRCQAHKDQPQLRGHSLMVLGADGRVAETRPVNKLDGWQASRIKTVKQARKYDKSERVDK